MKYRLYTFCNYYLSSIQQGIQSLHVAVELSISNDKKTKIAYQNWANKEKAVIVLNGGNSARLASIFVELGGFGYPSQFFKEDRDSLNGALTCVGVLVPDCVWDAFHEEYNSPKNQSFREYLYQFPLAH